MKLFFKHLARSILKKPLQPLVLVLTLTLSIALSVFSFVMRDSLTQEVELKQAAKYGNAQIAITLNGNSKSRFMFEKDAEKLLGDRAEISGTFEVPMFVGAEKQTVFSVATDFYTVGNTFDFSFVEYGKITPSTVSFSALISENFAKTHALKVGDTFQAEIFGGNKEYKVCGISKNKYLGSCDILVDITGIVRLMAKDSPLLSALGDNFKPCGSLYIHVYNAEEVQDCLEILTNAENFSDKTVTDVADSVLHQTRTDDLMSVIDVSVLLTSLLSAAVAFCCFYILAGERTEENYSFTLSGAQAWKLHLLQYAEILVYWAVSSLLALAIEPLLLHALLPYVGFRYANGKIGAWNAVKGIGFFLLVSLATVTVFVLFSRPKHKKHTHKNLEKKGVIWVLCITAILYISLFVLPTSWRFIAYMVAAVAVLLSLFIVSPILLKWIMQKANARAEKKYFSSFQLKNVPLRYARKNLYSVKILHNVSRLVSVLVCIVLSSSMVVGSAYGNREYNEECFTADYVVMNATESCEQKIQECDKLKGYYKTFFEVSSEGNLMSVNDKSVLGIGEQIKNLPKGNQVVISSGEAKRRGLKIGDSISIHAGGKDIDLVISEIVKTGMGFVLFDCEHFQIPYTFLMVSGADTIPKNEVLSQLTEKTALELAVIADVDTIFADKLETVGIFLKLGLLILIMLVVFSLIGMLDTLYESYRARKGEFTLYENSGMAKRAVGKMKFFEVGIAIAFGLAFGSFAFFISSFATNSAFYQFGLETFLNFFKLFK